MPHAVIEPEFRNKLFPAVFGALATVLGLVEFGSSGGPLDSRAVVMAFIAGALCLAGHCFSIFEFSKLIVVSQLVLGFVATIQVALVAATKVGPALEYVPLIWMVLATPAIHLGILAKHRHEWSESLYPVIAVLFGALAPSGLLWFETSNLIRIQSAVLVGLAAAIASYLVARHDAPVPEHQLVR